MAKEEIIKVVIQRKERETEFRVSLEKGKTDEGLSQQTLVLLVTFDDPPLSCLKVSDG